jgi:RNA polymerase sigma-70 factor, ECF subfamily
MLASEDIRQDRQQVAQLVKAAQDGDRAAFGQLFERFERHVFAVALRRTGDFNEAQELSQDVFIQAMQKISQLREPECFGGWLRSITHRMAINRSLRRSPATSMECDVLDSVHADEQTPLDDLMISERRDQFRAGLSELGRMDRETLEAFYCNGRSLLEMSDDFAAPVGTIKRRLHVARKRLAEKVEDLVAV